MDANNSPDFKSELTETHLKIGDLFYAMGRRPESASHFARAMELGADRVRCLFAIGVAEIEAGQYDRALDCFSGLVGDHSLSDDARCLAAINGGVAALKRGDQRLCISFLEDALALFGGESGLVRVEMGGISYAGSLYMIYYTMATAHQVSGDFARAVECFDLALNNERNGIENGLNVSLSRLEMAYCMVMTGLMDRRSWELHESRWDTGKHSLGKVFDPPAVFSDPRGKTVMVYSEQGYGDSIQFARFIKGLKSMGAAKTVLVTHKPLARLMSSVSGIDEVAVSGEAHSRYHLYLPIMSLPHFLGLGADVASYSSPYISVSEAPHRDDGPNRRPRVGLVWSGDPKDGYSQAVRSELDKRNVRLRRLMEAILPATEGLDIEFVSLQKEDRLGELSEFPSIANPMGGVADYLDTARIVSGLDLVISVDTSVAHLAGAMGKPVWMLSRYRGCWRWGDELHCLAKIWYPTMRIYRETEYDNWGPPSRRLAADLRVLIESR